MEKQLLTRVITQLVNEHIRAQDYGVSMLNMPSFNWKDFVAGLAKDKRLELFLLGFSEEDQVKLRSLLSDELCDGVRLDFSVEAAEESRNTGDESTFRILIIKRSELEKISSLRWLPEITLDQIYTKSCDDARKTITGTNSVIDNLIQALRMKSVRSILSFERVLDYLELLTSTPSSQLPAVLKSNYFRLGLCQDKKIDAGNPTKQDFVKRIRENHAIVERIGNLELAERQNITNYYTRENSRPEIPRLILKFYKTHDIGLLKQLELELVEACLKAARKAPPEPGPGPTPAPKKKRMNPTAIGAQLVFEGEQEHLSDIIQQVSNEVDNRPNTARAERVDVGVNNTSMLVRTEPVTEQVADSFSDDGDFGGIIRAEVQSPDEAIRDLQKYELLRFESQRLQIVWDNLRKISELLSEEESISACLTSFLEKRKKLVPFKRRLQDIPMLQVIAEYPLFRDYISAYERLLNAINDDFHKLWRIAPSNAKEIINIIVALDYLFITGESKQHAVPTPLNPLYLWKYVELAKEILSSRGVNDIGESLLSEEDKAFIIRKAEDIPDPLSVVLLPTTISMSGPAFLPLSGRIGTLPIYSNQPQINQSENGMDTLKQQIVRYLCLYPHAGMMLRLTVIDPPSVEAIVAMLKALNADKEFNISGIEVSIYRTKEVPNDWVEIEDDSLNDGMLAKVKGNRSLSFKLMISNRRLSYNGILSELQREQHLLIIFDPNEVRIETAQNNRQLHIHPLCVPKIYKYNPIEESVEIRPASEGGIFTTYSSILEKLNEHPSSFSHTSTCFYTPLKRETYQRFLEKTDWLVILDQSLKNWDIALRAASEKLFYKENSYRSIGIYSSNCRKFVLGYDTLVKRLGNFIPRGEGIEEVIKAIREVNDDGLLSIVSHSSNRIFDTNHGKGSLGIALAAINYKRRNPDALLVGLDTQLAQEWLSEREDGKLPDLIGIRLENDTAATVDVIEVKTFSGSEESFRIDGETINGHAVKQVSALDALIREMFGSTERITTVSRREILREQVFEGLFHASLSAAEKHRISEQLNDLFAGAYKLTVNKNIAFVDFENAASRCCVPYHGAGEYASEQFFLTTIGSQEIQAILSVETYLDAAPGRTQQNNVTPMDAVDEGMQNTPANEDTTVRSNEGAPVNREVSSTQTVASQTEATLQTTSTEQQATNSSPSRDERALAEKCAMLNKVFRDYGINAYPVTPENVREAARFTRFTIELKSGETVRSLERSKTDIGIQLEASGEILINHIKGTKYISVDVPFARTGSSIPLLQHLNLLDNSTGALDVIAGQAADGTFEILDVAGTPHMLIAGTTGSGKTVFLHSILVSLLYQYSANELEVLIIDPKQTDFIYFEGIPHLYGGHVVIDAEEALEKLQQINTTDKEARTAALRACRSKDIASYNQKNPQNKMKRLVVVIDEYSDLIQTAEMLGNRKDFEKNLLMLLQRVRNLGIHLIIATQRPSAQIITGALKAVIPFRASFRLPSHTDSQTILDMSGAENLLGKGDMLMVSESDVKRLQGLYISEEELDHFLQSI